MSLRVIRRSLVWMVVLAAPVATNSTTLARSSEAVQEDSRVANSVRLGRIGVTMLFGGISGNLIERDGSTLPPPPPSADTMIAGGSPSVRFHSLDLMRSRSFSGFSYPSPAVDGYTIPTGNGPAPGQYYVDRVVRVEQVENEAQIIAPPIEGPRP
ncbi:hypothetical protein [Tautonia plasticadhaerens]|uniref:Uncharacterized protein n=1 Tax=Tautonia plasticadhaerens TaxID=2527974 RepID=A0A518GXT0_9BACT|nr:hypothetical protein [Tautonia plasticadhaerens]QDV33400.1 hypothetical protein ElP_12710 [Tautonia plasticadhaerens]